MGHTQNIGNKIKARLEEAETRGRNVMVLGRVGRRANVPALLVPSEGYPKVFSNFSRILRTHWITCKKQQKWASPPKI